MSLKGSEGRSWHTHSMCAKASPLSPFLSPAGHRTAQTQRSAKSRGLGAEPIQPLSPPTGALLHKAQFPPSHKFSGPATRLAQPWEGHKGSSEQVQWGQRPLKPVCSNLPASPRKAGASPRVRLCPWKCLPEPAHSGCVNRQAG